MWIVKTHKNNENIEWTIVTVDLNPFRSFKSPAILLIFVYLNSLSIYVKMWSTNIKTMKNVCSHYTFHMYELWTLYILHKKKNFPHEWVEKCLQRIRILFDLLHTHKQHTHLRFLLFPCFSFHFIAICNRLL